MPDESYSLRGPTPDEARETRRAVRRWRKKRKIVTVVLGLLAFTVVCDHSGLVTPGLSPAPELDGRSVRVHRVIDGDTLEIDAGGRRERVRLIGVDCPELGHDKGESDAYWGRQSAAYARARCEGKAVTLKFDGTETRDRYGRLLAVVYLSDSETLNLALVRDGQAYVDRRFDSYLRPALSRAEGDARKAGRGLWKDARDDQQPAWRQQWLARRKGPVD